MATESALPEILNVLRRRRRLVIVAGLTGAVLAAAIGFVVPPRYTAKAEIIVAPRPVVSATGQLAVPDSPMSESAIQTTIAALTSRAQVQRVIDSLTQADKSHAISYPSTTSRGIAGLHQSLSALLAKWWAAAESGIQNHLAPPATSVAPSNTLTHKRDEPRIETFERNLRVFQERGSHVLAVTFTSTSAPESALIANRFVELYLQNVYLEQRDSTNRTLAWVDKRLPQLKGQLDQAEAAAQKYRITHGVVQGNQTDLLDQKVAYLNRQLTIAESTLADRQAQLAAVHHEHGGDAGRGTIAQTPETDSLRELQTQELQLLQTYAALTATLGRLHPKTQAVAAQLREVKSRMGREAARAKAGLAGEVKLAADQVALLRQRVASAQKASNEAQIPAARSRDLEHSAATIRQVYESFLQRREQLLDQREMISPDVRILSLAVPPDKPSSPNPLLFPIPALIGFAICGGLWAIVKDRLNQELRSSQDVNEALCIPCIGLVPRVRRSLRKRPHRDLMARPFGPYAEAVRSVAASLQLAVPRRISEAILITSSVPQEGKTTLAVSLAAYAATLGRRTVLVDLDFRCPAVWNEIGEAATSTLELLDSSDRSSVALVDVPGLGFHVLALYPRPSDPLTAYASGQLTHLLDCLRTSYDCVIVDSPPLLAVAETRLLAILADKVLFVTKWNSTRRDVARNALNLLHETYAGRQSGSDHIFGVVTQVDLRKHANYRYGDAAESYVRYARYYLRQPPSGSRHVAAALQLAGKEDNSEVSAVQ